MQRGSPLLPGRRSRRADIIDEAAAKVAATRAVLAGIALEPGSPAARIVLQAAASLRFLSDRFEIDRPFLLRSYA